MSILSSLADVSELLNSRGIENTFTGMSVNTDWCTITLFNGVFRVLEKGNVTVMGAVGLTKYLSDHGKSEREALTELYNQCNEIVLNSGLTWAQIRSVFNRVEV